MTLKLPVKKTADFSPVPVLGMLEIGVKGKITLVKRIAPI